MKSIALSLIFLISSTVLADDWQQFQQNLAKARDGIKSAFDELEDYALGEESTPETIRQVVEVLETQLNSEFEYIQLSAAFALNRLGDCKKQCTQIVRRYFETIHWDRYHVWLLQKLVLDPDLIEIITDRLSKANKIEFATHALEVLLERGKQPDACNIKRWLGENRLRIILAISRLDYLWRVRIAHLMEYRHQRGNEGRLQTHVTWLGRLESVKSGFAAWWPDEATVLHRKPYIDLTLPDVWVRNLKPTHLRRAEKTTSVLIDELNIEHLNKDIVVALDSLRILTKDIQLKGRIGDMLGRYYETQFGVDMFAYCMNALLKKDN